MYKSITSILDERPEASFQIRGYKTGFRKLDYCIDGIACSDLVLSIAKVSNHGSILLENFAAGLSKLYHVLLINTERSSIAVAEEFQKMLISNAGIPENNEELTRDLNHLAKNLFVEDKGRFLMDIDKTIEKFKAEYPDESIVLIDNLHGLYLSNEVRTYTRQQEEYEISQNLKMLTLKHNLPIILYTRIKSIDPLKNFEPPAIADIEHLMGLHCHFDKILGSHRPEPDTSDFESGDISTAYELHLHILKNGARKPEVVKLNISDTNRFSIFEKDM